MEEWESALLDFQARARQLGLLPAAYDALGAVRASQLAHSAYVEEAAEASLGLINEDDDSTCWKLALPSLPATVTSRDQLLRALSDSRFACVPVDHRAPADGRSHILWESSHRFWVDECAARALDFGHSFGQSEEWLVSKDALGVLLHLRVGLALWAPQTYRICSEKNVSGSLRNELAAFVGHYSSLSANASANVWIVKPATLSRSRDIFVSDRLDALLAACEACVRRGLVCVAQRYVTKPLLFRGHKFDLRLLVAVRSLSPLRLAVYDHVLCRAAAVPYLTAGSSDMRQHITVTQYAPAPPDAPRPPLLQTDVWAAEMTAMGVDVYGPHGVIALCHATVRQLFLAVRDAQGNVGRAGEPIGVRPHPSVRALYGLDVILDAAGGLDRLQPVVLEANYKPDITRVLNDRPGFVNQLFAELFTDDNPRTAGEHTVCPTASGAFIRL
jgi:Tubulin-tyrosine ligase family